MSQEIIHGLEYCGLFYGKYRAKVIDNSDPNNLGRIKVHCPQVHGIQDYPDTWALPIASAAGAFSLWHIPDVGDWVYVEFDHGRAEYPLWSGGWWGTGESPDEASNSKILLITKEGARIVLDRSDNSITLRVEETSIKVATAGIQVEGNLSINGDLSLTGELSVEGNADFATGASGVFTASGKVITVRSGLIISMV